MECLEFFDIVLVWEFECWCVEGWFDGLVVFLKLKKKFDFEVLLLLCCGFLWLRCGGGWLGS